MWLSGLPSVAELVVRKCQSGLPSSVGSGDIKHSAAFLFL